MKTTQGTIDASSWSVIGRTLLHFGYNKNENLDIFAGIGLGVGVWSYESDFKRNPFDDIGKSSGAQFILPIYLGGRYFFTDNLGATFEFATNVNLPISIGVSYRF